MSSKLERLDAPGFRIEGQHLHAMRREIATLMRRQQLGFPGAQPVSFSRKHMEELRTKDYYVCEKTDGIRYLLYLTEDTDGHEIQYLIDRKNDYWLLPPGALHLPRPDDEAGFHVKTLVDGELVFDNIAPSANGSGDAPPPQLQPTFLIFDCMVLDNKDLTERTLDKRLGYFKEAVYKPYDALFRKYPQEKQFQAFSIQMKDMQYSYGIEMMFRTVLPSLRHGNDGLIFTRCDSPYHPGTDQNILKWKPAEENTVDFKIQVHFPVVEVGDNDDDDDDDDNNNNNIDDDDNNIDDDDNNIDDDDNNIDDDGNNIDDDDNNIDDDGNNIDDDGNNIDDDDNNIDDDGNNIDDDDNNIDDDGNNIDDDDNNIDDDDNNIDDDDDNDGDDDDDDDNDEDGDDAMAVDKSSTNGHDHDNGTELGDSYPDYDALPSAELYAFYGNNTSEPYQLFAPMYLTEDEWELMKSTNDPISNRIIECGLDDQQRWRIHRFRDDKHDANHISTIRSVMESIQDSVSEQELKDAAKGFKEGWRARRQPPHK